MDVTDQAPVVEGINHVRGQAGAPVIPDYGGRDPAEFMDALAR